MSFQIKSTREAAESHGVKIMVYGRAGVGKTRLVATAPAPFLISAESGLLSLGSHDIPCVEIHTVADLEDVLKWVQESTEAAQFQTICLDSLTEIAEVILSEAKAHTKDGRAAYGDLAEKMTTLTKDFRDIKGHHVYFSAQEERTKSETGIASICPSMPGARLVQKIPFFFDELLYMGIGTLQDGSEYRYLKTTPDALRDAKDRSGKLDEIEEPDLSKIFNKILAR